jgi:TonB family protein
MRKALDTLLFSGDFTPTTFNLAFFMHSLYREDIEREAKRLKEDREASYLEFLTDEPGRPPGPSRPAAAAPPAAKTEPLDARAVAARLSPTPEPVHSVPPEPAPAPHASHPSPAAREAAPGASSKEAAAGFTFHQEEKKSKAGGLLVPIALVLLLGGGAAYYFLVVKGGAGQPAVPAPTAPPTLTPEAAAAQARIQELEAKLKAIEEEKAAAEAKAAEDAKKKVEAQAAARGQAVDPDAVERAQEEARKKAKAEQEKRQQEETRRLEDQKRAEEQRVAEEKRRAEELQARAAEQARADQAAAAATTAAATPPPSEAPSTSPIKPGTLVGLNDPGVVSPVVEKKPTLVYPPIALRQRVDGTVEVNALIDEKGNVIEVTVVSPAGGRAGLNEAAVDNVKRHKYRPATKDGVPVRVWLPLRVRFELPK